MQMYPDNVNPAAYSIILNNVLPYLASREYVFLEFGCSTGALGASIIKLDSRIRWTGLDINVDALTIAKTRLTSSFQFDFNQLKPDSLWSLNIKPDYIILVDVLEHVYEPKRFLECLAEVFSRSAILCVLPNIACYQTYDRISCHNFYYEDSGIFDRTHKTFYTASSAIELFCGLNYKPFIGPLYLPDPVMSSFQSKHLAYPFSFKRGKYTIEVESRDELLSLCSYGFAFLFSPN